MPRRSKSSNDDHDKTPDFRRRRPTVTCPHCRKPVEVMPSGLLALHPVHGRWAKSMCRGSGQPVTRRRRGNSRARDPKGT